MNSSDEVLTIEGVPDKINDVLHITSVEFLADRMWEVRGEAGGECFTAQIAVVDSEPYVNAIDTVGKASSYIHYLVSEHPDQVLAFVRSHSKSLDEYLSRS